MQLDQLKPKTAWRSKKRVGRGGKRGTFSGRGTKGQKARSGHRIRPELRDIIKKIPKLRGYRAKSIPRHVVEVDIALINAHFESGETVTPELLVRRGVAARINGNIPKIKILGSGEVAKKLHIKNCAISKGARAKLEKIGGSVSA